MQGKQGCLELGIDDGDGGMDALCSPYDHTLPILCPYWLIRMVMIDEGNVSTYLASGLQHGHYILLEHLPQFPLLAVHPLLPHPVIPLRARQGAAVPELPIGGLRVDHNRMLVGLDCQNGVRAGDVHLLLLVLLGNRGQTLQLVLGQAQEVFFGQSAKSKTEHSQQHWIIWMSRL